MGSAFGSSIAPAGLLSAFVLLRLFANLGLAADRLVCPGLRHPRISRPIVIGGNPRSGTTFLHRFMIGQGLGAGLPLWRMLFPSLTQQAFVRPLLPLLERVSPTRHHASSAHRTDLTVPEADDAALLFRFADGCFFYSFVLAWAERDLIEGFIPENRDTASRDIDWLEQVWLRSLSTQGHDRVIAKLLSVAIYLPSIVERYRDVRILYLLRDPLQTVPSTMSLVTSVIERRHGYWRRPESQRRRFVERLYRALLMLSLRFRDYYVSDGSSSGHIKLVPYDKMMRSFEDVMDDILPFVGIEGTKTLDDAIADTAERQRQFRSRHIYDCSSFGLTEARIREDYAPIYRDLLGRY
jgi:hypothetical protein